MASTTLPTASLPRSPVRFNTPSPDLCPQPLRLSQTKPKPTIDAVIGDQIAANTTPFPDRGGSSHADQDVTEATLVATTSTVGRSRSQTSKLGSLVSKFEILDAVNNANTESSRIPVGPMSRRAIESERSGRASLGHPARSHKVNKQPTLSDARSSFDDDSAELSPRKVKPPKPAARSSRLPTSTHVKSEVMDKPPLAHGNPTDEKHDVSPTGTEDFHQTKPTGKDPGFVMDKQKPVGDQDCRFSSEWGTVLRVVCQRLTV